MRYVFLVIFLQQIACAPVNDSSLKHNRDQAARVEIIRDNRGVPRSLSLCLQQSPASAYVPEVWGTGISGTGSKLDMKGWFGWKEGLSIY